MRRLNRSTNTPLGTAFFLFVSLAIIPVSLKAAGLKLGLTPRLSAAIDIWTEVAETFGSSYGAVGGSELAGLMIPDGSSQTAVSDKPSDEQCRFQERAHAREVEESSPEEISPVAAALPATMAKTTKTPRAGCRLSARAQASSKPVEFAVGPAGITLHVDTDVQSYRALNYRKVDAAMRREVLNRFDRMITPRGLDQPAIAPNPKSFRMVFRLKQTATSSVSGAECKARTALDAAVRLERASLNGSSAAPDNCDL